MDLATGDAPRVLVPLSIDAPPPVLGARVHVLSGETMGTTWSVRAASAAPRPPPAWRAAIEAELARVIDETSTWDEGSALAHFNRAAPGSRHALPACLLEVLDCALRVSDASGGAYDPTAGALVDLWGFGPGPRYDAPGFRMPDDAAAAAARALGGRDRLRFDRAAGSALQPGGLRLDLSAIAKGHAVDRVAARLHALGVEHLLVEIGGELRGHGLRPDGQPWWVELEAPDHPDPGAPPPAPTRIALCGLSVATSGDYRRCFVGPDGRRRAHTIDPRTGAPVGHRLASVSVVHEACMLADAWSTALMVLGPDEGLVLARRHGLAALLVVREDTGLREIASPELERLAR